MKNSELPSFSIIADTEYTSESQKTLTIQLLSVVDGKNLTSEDLNNEELDKTLKVINYVDVNPSFNPIHECTPLQLVSRCTGLELKSDLDTLTQVFKEKCRARHDFDILNFRRLEVTEQFCAKWNVPLKQIKKDTKGKKDTVKISLSVPIYKVDLTAHFLDADFFKLWGKDWQFLLLDTDLTQRRTLKGVIESYGYWGTQLVKVRIRLRDTMHRFPPSGGKGLAKQCEIFGVKKDLIKLDIITDEVAELIGVERTTQAIMGNIEILLKKNPDLFRSYAAMDCKATLALDIKQRELLAQVRVDQGLSEKSDIEDTTGSNVSALIKDLMFKHFEVSESKKITLKGKRKGVVVNNEESSVKVLTSLLSQTTVKNTQEISTNRLGFVPLRTVGGLLYSRMAKHPYISGVLGDLDIASAYGSQMANMYAYIGQPQIINYEDSNNPPTLREFIERSKIPQRCPIDGWYVRVSGKLDKALNTLILSDLRYDNKPRYVNTLEDILKGEDSDTKTRLLNRKHIERFNYDSVSVQKAESCILTKEVIHGLVNQQLLEVLATLPQEWYEEYLNLKVDTAIFVDSSLICDTVEEFESLYNQQNFELKYCKDFDTHQIVPSVNNVCLRFPISEYWNDLTAKRAVYKKAKDPIQEVYKLIINSGYGAFACVHLPVNNLLASNTITANIRSVAWLMMNALNGFQVITDGCTFSYDSIPVGLKFRDVLAKYPEYLVDYTSEIKSKIDPNTWINESYKQHLLDFYGLSKDSFLIKTFDYALKEEKFNGEDHLTFNQFWNNNSGNYTKAFGFDDNCTEVVRSIEKTELENSFLEAGELIDDARMLVDDQPIIHSKLKARGFKKQDESLWKWYSKSVKSCYSEHKFIIDTNLTKFRDSCLKAIPLLQTRQEVRLPCGYPKYVVKIPKLISRSQFLFQTRDQLRKFEDAQKKLDQISNNLITREDWENLKVEDLDQFGIKELNFAPEDYFEYSKTHSVGLGWEILCVHSQKARCKTLGEIRSELYTMIMRGDTAFKDLYYERNKKKRLGVYAKSFLMACSVFKKDYEEQFVALCLDRLDDPTSFNVNSENIKRLKELYPG